MANDKNYVSIWFWLLAMIVMALPCINVVMILVWAFSGENESRKNYFRALLIMFLFWAVLWGILMTIGIGPELLKKIQESTVKV